MLRVESIQKLLQAIEQQELAVVSRQLDVNALRRPHRAQVFNDSAEKGNAGLGKQRIQVRGTNAQSEVGGMFEEFVHGSDATAQRESAIAETLHSRERFI